MTDDTDEPTRHEWIFRETSRAVTLAAQAFSRGVAPTLSPADAAKIYSIAAVTLALGALGDAATATMLREIANGIEGGGPPTVN